MAHRAAPEVASGGDDRRGIASSRSRARSARSLTTVGGTMGTIFAMGVLVIALASLEGEVAAWQERLRTD